LTIIVEIATWILALPYPAVKAAASARIPEESNEEIRSEGVLSNMIEVNRREGIGGQKIGGPDRFIEGRP